MVRRAIQSNHGKLIQMRILNTIALMLDQLEPQVAAPHSPANTASVVEYNDIHPDVLYLGACTGAKLHDLRAAASILKENRVQSGIEFWVAPSSKRDFHEARKEGVMKILEDAGAKILPTSCGLCAGYGLNV